MNQNKRNGFTLVELLVVVAIVVVLLAMLLPAIQRIREAANKVVCASNLRTIGQGLGLYLRSNKNCFPTGGGDNTTVGQPRTLVAAGFPATGLNQDWGWMYQILPYIEHESLWKIRRGTTTDPWGIFPGGFDPVGDLEIATTPVTIYFFPSRRSPMTLVGDNGERAVNDYAGNMGAFTPILETGAEHDP